MKKLIIFLATIFFFFSVQGVKAIYNPTGVPNNHFGMHVIDTNDLQDVAKLTNSNGGDWGYVTFVIQKGERNPKHWQSVFDEMRRLHLIPIVRIASAPIPGNSNVWEKPSIDEIDGWVSFLNSLNWVIKNRYVVIGNEPNHASEWGGEVDPTGYAKYLKAISEKLKNSNEDFFVMPAGFDASADNSKGTMEEPLYLEKMIESDPDVFQNIDGWSSHSYPNPDFSGPGEAIGKGTVRTYEWELNYLKFLGVTKELPVFITEAGWTHKTDSLTTDIGPKIETAFKNAWSDKRVIAVTPFIFKYLDPPFDIFSWKNKEGQVYDFYNTVLDLTKVTGVPIQEYKADTLTGVFPKIALANSKYNGVLIIKNTGQSIWSKDALQIFTTKLESIEIKSMFPEKVEPGQIGIFLVDGRFPNSTGNYDVTIELANNREVFSSDFTLSANLIPNLPNINDILNYLKMVIARRLNLGSN